MKPEQLQGKRIGIVGFGVEGQAVAKYLSKHGFAYEIFERTPGFALPPQFGSAPLHSGEGYLTSLAGCEVIFRSPGVPLNTPELAAAAASGAALTSQIKFFLENCPTKNIIGITGTKGKGTTAALIHQMLMDAGLSSFLAGNFGPDAINLLANLKESDWVVLELSSFQLQDLEMSPHIAVVLMTTADHLDYHADEREYVEAKSAITKFQVPADFAVINADFENSMAIGKKGSAKKSYVQTVPASAFDSSDPFKIYSPEQYLKIRHGVFAEQLHGGIYLVEDGILKKYFEIRDLQLRGFHMVQNVCAAISVARILKIREDIILDALKNFTGLEHRLQFVVERAGIKFYNDSIGTTPEACIAAIQAFSEPEIAIVGGQNKGADYEALAKQLVQQKNLKGLALIGEIAPRLEVALKEADFKGVLLTGVATMPQVFEKIATIAQRGDVVVLAPATSSRDMFADYKDRGEKFSKAARQFEPVPSAT